MSVTTTAAPAAAPRPPSFGLNALTQAFKLSEAVMADPTASPELRRSASELSDSLLELDAEALAQTGAIEVARDTYCNDDIEIDGNPIVSVGDEGTWVSAWVFVRSSASETTEH